MPRLPDAMRGLTIDMVASLIVGVPTVRRRKPCDIHRSEVSRFWSDRYDTNLRVIGLPGDASVSIARGTPDKRGGK